MRLHSHVTRLPESNHVSSPPSGGRFHRCLTVPIRCVGFSRRRCNRLTPATAASLSMASLLVWSSIASHRHLPGLPSRTTAAMEPLGEDPHKTGTLPRIASGPHRDARQFGRYTTDHLFWKYNRDVLNSETRRMAKCEAPFRESEIFVGLAVAPFIAWILATGAAILRDAAVSTTLIQKAGRPDSSAEQAVFPTR